MAHKWSLADMPSQSGKLALITGGNRGLGLEIGAGLAAAGAQVVIACRDASRADAALAELRRRVPGAKVSAMSLDLADLASVRRFAADFAARHPRLDLLCNNASAILVPKGRTRDGFETHIGTNHLGHFLLTGLLLPQLRAAPSARIVNTSSLAHKMTPGLDLADLNVERTPYKDMDAYGRSKQAALLFTLELGQRLAGTGIVAAAAHPGWSNTNPDNGGFFMRLANSMFAQSAAAGALPALYALTAPDVRSGDFIGPGGLQQMGGAPKRVESRADARDPATARGLWELSERLTGANVLCA